MPKTQTYENLGGLHLTFEGVAVKKGETFESADPELLTKFPNKFRLANAQAAPVNAAAPKGTNATDGADKAPSGQAGADGAPVDVTGDFDVADGAGITVRKNKKGWSVFEEGDDDPLNEKPLNKNKVQAFIDDYLEE